MEQFQNLSKSKCIAIILWKVNELHLLFSKKKKSHTSLQLPLQSQSRNAFELTTPPMPES